MTALEAPDREALSKFIEEKRQQLHGELLSGRAFGDPAIHKISEELDRLVSLWMQLGDT